MALYWGLPGREEDADDPEKIVRRVQEVSAVLYHLEQVAGAERVLPGGVAEAWVSGRGEGRALGLWAGSEAETWVSGWSLELDAWV